jgi:hypothetical protein
MLHSEKRLASRPQFIGDQARAPTDPPTTPKKSEHRTFNPLISSLITDCLSVFPEIRCSTVSILQAIDQLGTPKKVARRIFDESMTATFKLVYDPG